MFVHAAVGLGGERSEIMNYGLSSCSMGLKIALLCESFSEMAKAQGEFEPNLVHADSLFSVL